jgi:hypothetical protein
MNVRAYGLALVAAACATAAWSADRLTAPTPLERQVADLQNQVAVLQSQMNALLAAIQVTQTGVVLQGPKVAIAADAIDIRSGTTIALNSGANMTVQASATLDLRGATTRLNGGNKPIATVGSAVQAPNGSGQIVTGSQTVFAN